MATATFSDTQKQAQSGLVVLNWQLDVNPETNKGHVICAVPLQYADRYQWMLNTLGAQANQHPHAQNPNLVTFSVSPDDFMKLSILPESLETQQADWQQKYTKAFNKHERSHEPQEVKLAAQYVDTLNDFSNRPDLVKTPPKEANMQRDGFGPAQAPRPSAPTPPQPGRFGANVPPAHGQNGFGAPTVAQPPQKRGLLRRFGEALGLVTPARPATIGYAGQPAAAQPYRAPNLQSFPPAAHQPYHGFGPAPQGVAQATAPAASTAQSLPPTQGAWAQRVAAASKPPQHGINRPQDAGQHHPQPTSNGWNR